MYESIADEVRDFVVDSFMFGDSPAGFSDQTSLLEKGLIDSTDILELIVFVEERYGIKVSDEDVRPTNFDSVERIASFAQRQLSSTSTAVR